MTRRGLPADPPASPAQAIVNASDHAASSSSLSRASATPQRGKLTVELPSDLIDELRDAVVYLPSQGVQATVAGVVEQAVHGELTRLREDHHGGQRFPVRHMQPRVGRPVGR